MVNWTQSDIFGDFQKHFFQNRDLIMRKQRILGQKLAT